MSTPAMGWKKLALCALGLFVGLSAAMGILTLILGQFGWIEIRVLLTTVALSGASICALTCAALWESKQHPVLPMAGIVLTIAGTLLLIIAIWVEPDSEIFWKGTASIVFFAVATTHISLLSLADISKRFMWSRVASYICVYGLALTLSIMIWGAIDEDGFFRFVGVLSILVAALSIATPIFHKLSCAENQKPVMLETEQASPIRMLCPVCEKEFLHDLGEIICPVCQTVFVVTIRKNSYSN